MWGESQEQVYLALNERYKCGPQARGAASQ